MRDFWGTLSISVKQTKVPYLFYWEQGIALHACSEIGPHLSARGKYHGFSSVAAGTWGIFSSYSGNGHSKLEFVNDIRTPV